MEQLEESTYERPLQLIVQQASENSPLLVGVPNRQNYSNNQQEALSNALGQILLSQPLLIKGQTDTRLYQIAAQTINYHSQNSTFNLIHQLLPFSESPRLVEFNLKQQPEITLKYQSKHSLA
jgi:hypothetical protein